MEGAERRLKGEKVEVKASGTDIGVKVGFCAFPFPVSPEWSLVLPHVLARQGVPGGQGVGSAGLDDPDAVAASAHADEGWTAVVVNGRRKNRDTCILNFDYGQLTGRAHTSSERTTLCDC